MPHSKRRAYRSHLRAPQNAKNQRQHIMPVAAANCPTALDHMVYDGLCMLLYVYVFISWWLYSKVPLKKKKNVAQLLYSSSVDVFPPPEAGLGGTNHMLTNHMLYNPCKVHDWTRSCYHNRCHFLPVPKCCCCCCIFQFLSVHVQLRVTLATGKHRFLSPCPPGNDLRIIVISGSSLL